MGQKMTTNKHKVPKGEEGKKSYIKNHKKNLNSIS